MNQRQIERRIYRNLALRLDAMDAFELAGQTLGELNRPRTATERERFKKAKEFVSGQLWQRAS